MIFSRYIHSLKDEDLWPSASPSIFCTNVILITKVMLNFITYMCICNNRGADLYMAQLIPLPLTVSCSSKIQISFSILVPAHLGSP